MLDRDAFMMNVQLENEPSRWGGGQTHITAVVNGERVRVLSYYPDEISFTVAELEGRKVDVAFKLFMDRDMAYLQAP